VVAPEKIIGRGKLDSNHTEHCLKRKRRAWSIGSYWVDEV